MPLTIGMIAHDRKKPELAQWASDHAGLIMRHRIVATATTGSWTCSSTTNIARCVRVISQEISTSTSTGATAT